MLKIVDTVTGDITTASYEFDMPGPERHSHNSHPPDQAPHGQVLRTADRLHGPVPNTIDLVVPLDVAEAQALTDEIRAAIKDVKATTVRPTAVRVPTSSTPGGVITVWQDRIRR
ncbi:hypothetical protein ACFYXM_11160 [Streptomyces sp. NPDC002476]|uniref:hypothetical protein n=1 Tax=Streptomyces sp. NPDC002476 TaxID=3364648 RepID=UPI0036ADC8CE